MARRRNVGANYRPLQVGDRITDPQTGRTVTVTGFTRPEQVYRGGENMARRRTDQLTRVTESRTDVERTAPVQRGVRRISAEEYERNPNKWRTAIPVTSAMSGKVESYIVRKAG